MRARVRAASALAASLAVLVVAPSVVAATAGGHLTLAGSVHGPVTVIRVVCNSHVALAKHKFFLDVFGTSGGEAFIFSGDVDGYTGPRTYHTFSGILHADGKYLYAHNSGTVAIGAGSTAGHVTVRVQSPPGEAAGAATVTGAFTCNAFTNA